MSSSFFKRNRSVIAISSAGIAGLVAWKVDRTIDEIARAFAFLDAKYEPPYMHAGAVNNPKFDKRWKGGEDAMLVSENGKLIMVADGVGGWTKKDVDPGKYSKFLAKQIGKIYGEKPEQDLKATLIEAVKANPNKGSTTACMAKLDGKDKLKTCNLGDSGYLIVRPNKAGELEKVFRSESQQHYFNCPYQCGDLDYYRLPTNA